MARKTKRIVIAQEGRDKGKVFLLEEMSALDAEMWAADALFGLAQSGVDLPDDWQAVGMPVVLVMGFKALGKLQPPVYRDLMGRLMNCVRFVPDPKNEMLNRHPDEFASLGGDIEEVKTRTLLKAEVFSLHTNFTLPDVLSLGPPAVPSLT